MRGGKPESGIVKETDIGKKIVTNVEEPCCRSVGSEGDLFRTP